MEVQTWPIGRVTVRDRIRRRLGDLAGLKTSMTERGQINPITVAADGVLITGERRLRAAQELGWLEIDVHIWRQATDLERLYIEGEENLDRKDWTPGEAEMFWQRVKELLRPEAEKAQKEGGREGGRGGKTAGQGQPSPESGEPSRHDRQTGRKAAKATGYSEDTLKKVEEVRTTAEDETQPEEVRAEAQRQHEGLMEGTTKVAPALAAVQEAQRRADRLAKEEAKLATGLAPGQWIEPPPPSRPKPGLAERVVTGIGKGRGLEKLAAEIQDNDLDLDTETVFVLRNRMIEEIAARKTMKVALDHQIEKRGFNKRKRTP